MTAIVGYGLIGGSIELALRRFDPSSRIVTLDEGDDLAAIEGATLVVLAAPVSANLALLRSLPAHLTQPTVVTDTGSTKAATMAAAEALPPHVRFVGGHPMAGGATSGRASARADLFDGKPWILTPSRGVPAADVARVTAFVESLGATPRIMDAAEHDRLVAYISHLPQLAVSALMHVSGEGAGEAGLSFAGNGLRDSTRLAASPAPLWREIVASNRTNVNAALEELISALQQLRGDDGRLEQILENAARWKCALEASDPDR